LSRFDKESFFSFISFFRLSIDSKVSLLISFLAFSFSIQNFLAISSASSSSKTFLSIFSFSLKLQGLFISIVIQGYYQFLFPFFVL
jgi:hypothetical protein